MFRIKGYTGPEIEIDLPDMEIDRDICDLTDNDACVTEEVLAGWGLNQDTQTYEMDDCGNAIGVTAKANLVRKAWELI